VVYYEQLVQNGLASAETLPAQTAGVTAAGRIISHPGSHSRDFYLPVELYKPTQGTIKIFPCVGS